MLTYMGVHVMFLHKVWRPLASPNTFGKKKIDFGKPLPQQSGLMVWPTILVLLEHGTANSFCSRVESLPVRTLSKKK